MLVDNLHNEAAKQAAELDAEITFENQDQAWDHIEHRLRIASDGGEYMNTSEALKDFAVTIARLKNYLDYINENGSDDTGVRNGDYEV